MQLQTVRTPLVCLLLLALASARLPGRTSAQAPTNSTIVGSSSGLGLKVVGDDRSGYGVEILWQGQPVARHNEGGEFSATFQNGDRSVEASLTNWRAARWQNDPQGVTLLGAALDGSKGQIEERSGKKEGAVGGPVQGQRGWVLEQANLRSLWANATVSVTYQIVNEHVLKKTIRLLQTDAPQLYFHLNNRLEALAAPASYWSFEADQPSGGALHQVFPAVGFRLQSGAGVGLLTDAGYKNHWAGTDRRRGANGFVSLLSRPDVNLVCTADAAARAAGKHFVEMNFGELRDYRGARETELPPPKFSAWKTHLSKSAGPTEAGIYRVEIDSAEPGNRGIIIPLDLKANAQYRLSFEHRGNCGHLGLRLWNRQITQDAGGLYMDAVTTAPEQWSRFSQTFTPSADGGVYLHIGRGYKDTQPGSIELRNLQIVVLEPQVQGYDVLKMGEPAIKTLVIFIQPTSGMHEMRLDSQVCLAEGLGFKGTESEKILYATQRMLCWNTEPGLFTPLVVPSLSYSPDSYMRDSMWICLASHDRSLAERVLASWGNTQDERGCIDTIITPFIGSMENVDNDSTFYYVLWSYANQHRYGSKPDLERVGRALQYCRRTWDPERTGVMRSRTPASTDTMWLNEKIVWADNQGIYSGVLRACKAMGLDVSDTEINHAQAAYRSLYQPEYGYVLFGDGPGRREIISPSSLMGEFLSLWLWNEPLLSDEAVTNTLNKLKPTAEGGLPGWAYYDKSRGYVYFSETNHPFSGGRFPWQPGVYVNGGSWLLYDYMAYAAGMKHGWKPARERMQQRLDAQFKRYPDWPMNFEWLPTTVQAAKDYPPEKLTKVFGWDTFILTVNEMLGLRQACDDPDSQSSEPMARQLIR